MNFFIDEENNYIFRIITIILLLIVICLVSFNIYKGSNKEKIIIKEQEEVEIKEPTVNLIEEKPKIIKVDIKGYIKNAGVYEVEEGSIVNDIIKLAGGIKTGGTTKNINLSHKVKDEMVIRIFSTQELNKLPEQTKEDCICNNIVITECDNSSIIIKDESSKETVTKSEEQKEIVDNKVSINNGTLEELMTLNGIGEAKAKAIIEYRNKEKFNKLEDIMNVSGIGESAYQKIKDSIKL